MKKKYLLFNFFLLINVSFAMDSLAKSWQIAYNYYIKNQLKPLNLLAIKYSQDYLINYLNADANLKIANPKIALNFINQLPASAFNEDLKHKLLTFYYNHQDWQAYLTVCAQLSLDKTLTNETCGYDFANLKLNNQYSLQTKLQSLIKNKLPLWCIPLVASQLNSQSQDKRLFLYNLIINNQIYQFNQYATFFKVTKLPSKHTGSYQIVYLINNLAHKDQALALAKLKKAAIDSYTKGYLYNIIGIYAINALNLQLSARAFDLGSNNTLSNAGYRAKVRAYLATSQWKSVIKTINAMPENLKLQKSFQYWLAYSYDKLGQEKLAYQYLKNIPQNFSYYSILAQDELDKNINLKYSAPKKAINKIKYYDAFKYAQKIYLTGLNLKSLFITTLAENQTRYIVGLSSESDIDAISQYAINNKWYIMGIYAATRLASPEAALSFPTPYLNSFKKYAKTNQVDPAYLLAITRHESRFKSIILATDGGIGLMQLMPGTAKYIARKINSPLCHQDYDCNIKFGAWYAGHLAKKFGYNFIYALAGYNAGPGRANRWQQALLHLDNRIQIELIPFDITREYVQSTLANYAIYDALLNNNSKVKLLTFLASINNQKATYILDQDLPENNSQEAD